MTLPTGTISMSQVRAELGLSGPISLGQTAVRNLSGQTSGAVTMNALRGKSAVSINMTDHVVDAYAPNGQTATAAIYFAASGELYYRVNGSYDYMGNWRSGGAAGDFSIIVHNVGGPLFGSTKSQWISMASDQQWYIQETLQNGGQFCNFSLNIRYNPTGLETSNTINLSATTGQLG